MARRAMNIFDIYRDAVADMAVGHGTDGVDVDGTSTAFLVGVSCSVWVSTVSKYIELPS